MSAPVVVLGSANLDFVYRVARIPRPGETLLALGAEKYAGGKGNNQVIAVARAGAAVSFIGSLGDDDAGATLAAVLSDAGVTDLSRRCATPTGTAMIAVDERAENAIIVHAGANAELRYLTRAEVAAISEADYLLMQLEIPLETVVEAARAARIAGTQVVLNAAPIQDLPTELLSFVDLLVVNEHEARLLAGIEADPTDTAVRLLDVVPAVVITLGAEGAIVAQRSNAPVQVPAARVEPVDTTGAGDTFCGALVAALSEGSQLLEAAGFASFAAALSVQQAGAVPSIPNREQIDTYRQDYENH